MFRRNFLGTLVATVVVSVAGSPSVAADTTDRRVWSFDADEVGKAPAGFEFSVTAQKRPGKWVIVQDGKNRALAQVDRDKTPRRFAIALVENSHYKDLKLSVRTKPVTGDEEMVARLVWRYQDPDNYYATSLAGTPTAFVLTAW